MLGFDLVPGAVGGLRDPLASFFTPPRGGKVAIAPGVAGGLSVWSEIGNGHAAWLRLDNTDPGVRLSWRETLVTKLRRVYPVGALTLTGGWSQLQSSGSGLASSYTGNRAVSTSDLNATASVTVSRDVPYDLWVHYTGRTNGGYLRVQIDGGDALVNEIGDPAGLGFKAFATYSATDLDRRQVIRVASGLTGAHQVTLSCGGAAAPGGNAVMLEAVSISATLDDPGVLPPMWEPQTSYTMGDEVQWGGTFYAARATGLSGTVPPGHLAGIGSDGALDWRADNRPTYPDLVAVDYASEREYAIRFAASGVTSEVGGQTHGNEPLVSRTILLDGQAWVPETGGTGLSAGHEITMTEVTEWQTGAGAKVADATLVRRISAGRIGHEVTASLAGPEIAVEWFYPAMLPLVHWDGESAGTVFDTVHAWSGSVSQLAAFAGAVPPNRDLGRGGKIGAQAQIGETRLRYGLSAQVALSGGGSPLALSAFLRPNLEGRSASGSLDWPAKAYVSAGRDGGLTMGGGDVLSFASTHAIAAV